MQTVIDGNLINYEVIGSKNRNIILILHGWKRSLKDWENIALKLSDKQKIVLVDLPGFGNSSVPKQQPFDTYDYVNTIGKFIGKLGLKNIVLIGHSFGGKMGIVLASQNKEIKKIILVDPSGINSNNILVSVKINLYQEVKFLLPDFLKTKISRLFSSEDYKSAGNLISSFKKIVTQDISIEAKKIKIPTLIVWGENDKDVTLGSAKKLKKLISNSTLRIVWRAGHHPHLEKPEKFLEIIQEFI